MPYALGIDLGSGHLSAALCRNERDRWSEPEVLALDGAAATESVLHLTDEGAVEVGSRALQHVVTRPDRVTRGVVDRVGDDVAIMLGGRPYPAEVLIAAVVGWVSDYAEAMEGMPASHLVVTHPASWGGHRRTALQAALRDVSLPEVTLLPRPVAAAESYAATEQVEIGHEIAVHSLGASRFESAVLRRGSFGFELRAHAASVEPMGGELFDDLLAARVLGELGTEVEPVALAKLRAACRSAKERLSTELAVTVPAPAGSKRGTVMVNRTDLEELVRPAVEATVATLQRTIQAAGTSTGSLRAVVLVGGCGRIPLVSELVSAGVRARVTAAAEPELSVARGAARAAARVAKPTVHAPALAHAPARARPPATHTDLMNLDDVADEELPDVGPPPPRPPVDIAPLEPPKRRLLNLTRPRGGDDLRRGPAPEEESRRPREPRPRRSRVEDSSSFFDDDPGGAFDEPPRARSTRSRTNDPFANDDPRDTFDKPSGARPSRNRANEPRPTFDEPFAADPRDTHDEPSRARPTRNRADEHRATSDGPFPDAEPRGTFDEPSRGRPTSGRAGEHRPTFDEPLPADDLRGTFDEPARARTTGNRADEPFADDEPRGGFDEPFRGASGGRRDEPVRERARPVEPRGTFDEPVREPEPAWEPPRANESRGAATGNPGHTGEPAYPDDVAPAWEPPRAREPQHPEWPAAAAEPTYRETARPATESVEPSRRGSGPRPRPEPLARQDSGAHHHDAGSHHEALPRRERKSHQIAQHDTAASPEHAPRHEVLPRPRGTAQHGSGAQHDTAPEHHSRHEALPRRERTSQHDTAPEHGPRHEALPRRKSTAQPDSGAHHMATQSEPHEPLPRRERTSHHSNGAHHEATQHDTAPEDVPRRDGLPRRERASHRDSGSHHEAPQHETAPEHVSRHEALPRRRSAIRQDGGGHHEASHHDTAAHREAPEMTARDSGAHHIATQREAASHEALPRRTRRQAVAQDDAPRHEALPRRTPRHQATSRHDDARQDTGDGWWSDSAGSTDGGQSGQGGQAGHRRRHRTDDSAFNESRRSAHRPSEHRASKHEAGEPRTGRFRVDESGRRHR